ncbi:MAG: a-glycosyltransferase, Glycosyltransferase Family 4-like protein [Ilumatobacteraceae bacterium]|nr:a-glycosyltransferase, Glycosyltransferase Family 4-like protein [Ilumatobacteraceae bacterium]
MNIVIFCHSLVSDWNHGNAHFLRGVVSELQERGHDVRVHEPLDGWSRTNLVVDHGRDAVRDFERAFPTLRSSVYDLTDLDIGALTDGADLVIVHEWNDPAVVAAVGQHRRAGGYRLLFHDTHHRMVTAPEEMAAFDLRHYDGVLAFGQVISELYLARGLADRAWTWHEAADVRTFHPLDGVARDGDVVWIGNWGDGERTAELHEFLLGPVGRLGLSAHMYGVRYPPEAHRALGQAGIRYGGWRANHRAPAAFAAHAVTVHVPRRPYVVALPGIPTIRPFEAMACGIPLICAPWEDAESLFRPGTDYLEAANGAEAEHHLDAVLHDPELAASLRAAGLETIRRRHTCGHRVDELLAISAELGIDTAAPTIAAAS